MALEPASSSSISWMQEAATKWSIAKAKLHQDVNDMPEWISKILKSSNRKETVPTNTQQYLELYETSHEFRNSVSRIADIVVSLAALLRLDLYVASTGIIYVHKYLQVFRINKTEKKILAAAAILLAWKLYEDRGGTKCPKKIWEIPKALYTILESDAWSNNLREPLIHEWILQDSGKKFSILCEKIKSSEACLLRAINFRVQLFPLSYPLITPITKCLMASVSHHIGIEIEFLYDLEQLIRHLAILITFDCIRTPFWDQFTQRELAIGAVWKASIRRDLHIFVGDHYENVMNHWFQVVNIPNKRPISYEIMGKLFDTYRSFISSAWRMD